MTRAMTRTLVFLCSLSILCAQQQNAIAPVRPSAPIIVRPYLSPYVPPPRFANSARFRDLIRAGIMYLTVQDAIALALENNIDIEVARYNPLIAAWNLQRAQAGGALPGVPSGASQAGTVASGQGVAGSQQAAGVRGGSAVGSNNSTNAQISQIGPVTQVLDPIVQETTAFGHTSIPQPNVVQSVTPNLISNTKVYNVSLQQGTLTGGIVTLNFTDHYLNENAPTDLLNPSVEPSASISIQHNLLRGFGIAVNARNITIARINANSSDLAFKTQLINVVSQVVDAYYALAADYDDVKAKQSALTVAQNLYSNSKEQLRVGAMAPLDVTSAQVQVATAQQDLVSSQTILQEQQISLKNLLSGTGTADPILAAVQIVPVDRIVVPEKDDLPPVENLVRTALANRSDLAVEKRNLTTAEISALGTRNGILPTVQAFGGESHTGLAGTPRAVFAGPNGRLEAPDVYFVGGIGTALGQIARRNFPTDRVGAFGVITVRNRQAQADYGADQLQLRQSQLATQKDVNQVEVDVRNYVIAVQQTRARYAAAVQNRVLEQQLFDAEQRRLNLGASTPYNVIQQQRDLVAAQFSEMSASSSYAAARIALDQTLGTTLETYHITLHEALNGRVNRPSVAPPAPER